MDPPLRRPLPTTRLASIFQFPSPPPHPWNFPMAPPVLRCRYWRKGNAPSPVVQWSMNWTGAASHPRMALPPVWKFVTGDQVTSTNEWGNPVNKRLRCCFRRPASPCGNAGIGRLLHIMSVLSGQGYLERRPSSRQVPRPALSSQWQKAGIGWARHDVQCNRASFGRQSREKA